MVALANRVKVNTATAGTGTVTLGAASANNFFTFAEGGITNGQTVAYLIEESLDFEYGTGVYTSAGTTMTRATVIASKIAGVAGTTKMTLAGAATVSIVALKEHFIYDGNANTTAVVGVGSIELGAASDTTVARTAAGRVTVEAVPVNTYTYSAAPPPGSAIAGDVWVDSDDLTEYTYVNDGDSSQWVNLSTAGTDTHPVTTVDNTVARYDGTGGYLQSSNVFIDDSNRISTGGSALQTLGSVIPQIQVLTPNVAGPGMATSSWVNSAFGAGVFMSHSRGTTVGDYTIVQDGDRLGIITVFGADGVDLDNNAANISFNVDGTPSSTAMPARISFHTRTSTSAPAERMRIDNSGRMVLGGTAAISTYDGTTVNPRVQVHGLTQPDTIISNTIWSADTTPAKFNLAKSRGATVGSYTVVQSGDGIGNIAFQASDGTDFAEAGKIMCKVDSTPGSNDMPGRLEFYTTPDGTQTSVERMRIDNGGRTMIGGVSSYLNICNAYSNDSPGALLNVYGDPNSANITVGSWTAADGGPGELVLACCPRNATVGTFTVAQSGDSLGSIGFCGTDGTNFETAARITVKVDGTPGADDMPGRIEFSTTRDGASLPELKLTIPADGGLQFPASVLLSASGNSLDDYEEGSWTPLFAANASQTGVTYSQQVGNYTKIGNTVHIRCNLVLTSNGTGVGSATIPGAPFTSANDANIFGHLFTGGSAATGIYAAAQNASTIIALAIPGATARTLATDTNCTDTFNFTMCGIYFTNS